MLLTKINTKSGREIILPSHSNITVSDSVYNNYFKSVSDLKVDDNIFLKLDFRLHWRSESISNNTSWLLGLIVGDGHYNYPTKKGYRIDLTNLHSENGEYYRDLVKSEFGLECKLAYRSGSKATTYYFINKNIRMYLFSLGLKFSSKRDKEIPISIFSQNSESAVNFICGLFDSDGHLNDNGLLLVTISKKIALQFQMLLGSLGYNSFITHTRNGRFSHYRVTLFSFDSRNFIHNNLAFLKAKNKYKRIDKFKSGNSNSLQNKKQIKDLIISESERKLLYKEILSKYACKTSGGISLPDNLSRFFRMSYKSFNTTLLKYILSRISINGCGPISDALSLINDNSLFHDKIISVESVDSESPSFNTIPLKILNMYDLSSDSIFSDSVTYSSYY